MVASPGLLQDNLFRLQSTPGGNFFWEKGKLANVTLLSIDYVDQISEQNLT